MNIFCVLIQLNSRHKLGVTILLLTDKLVFHMQMLAHLAGRCEGQQTQLAGKRSIADRDGRNAAAMCS